MRTMLIVSWLFLLCVPDVASLRFARIFTHHMVLQRAPKQPVVWGYADKVGDTVTIFRNHVTLGSTIVVANPHAGAPAGVWKIKLPADNTFNPYTLTAQSSEGNVTLRDVISGEVWLCSGQSNMYFQMGQVNDSATEIADALTHSTIRLLRILPHQSSVPLDEPVSHGQDGWTRPLHTHIEHFSAVCYLTALELQKHLHVPFGLIEASVGGTKIELWSPPETLNSCHVHLNSGRRAIDKTATSSLWNAMVHPFVNTVIKGVLWYQGEANSNSPDSYKCLFRQMYLDWGEKFYQGTQHETDQKLPFGVVQLAGTKGDIVGGFPQLRWSQSYEYGYVPNKDLPTVFMALALDLPDPDSPYGSIHPRYKQDVAYRLSLGARTVAYGVLGVEFQGPFPSGFTAHSAHHELVITFDKHIHVKNNHSFEVCCSHDLKDNCTLYTWTAAPIKAHTVTTVTLDVSVCHGNRNLVTGVRYLWRQTPCDFKDCAIYGSASDLPAPPFINDLYSTGPPIIG